MSREDVGKSILGLCKGKKTQYPSWNVAKTEKLPPLTHQRMVTSRWQEILFNVFPLLKSYVKKKKVI